MRNDRVARSTGPVPRKMKVLLGEPVIEEEDVDAVSEALRTRWIGTGPRVREFEEQFSALKGGVPTAAVSSGTAALHLALVAAGVGPGDEVITTPLTFCATVNAVLFVGAQPVLADVEPRSMNIDPRRIGPLVTSSTRAIIAVHFAGRPCDMAAIMSVADEHDLVVIEDCAHAIEASIEGRPTGTFGHFGCFSFYPSKNMTTGEGGMVTARNPGDADAVRRLSNHGQSKGAWERVGESSFGQYEVTALGFKYNLTDMGASLGLSQMRRLERWLDRRAEIWSRYSSAMGDLPLQLPAGPDPGTVHARHLFTVLVDSASAGIGREEFVRRMTSQGVGTGIHYTTIPDHSYYRDRFGWDSRDWPSAKYIGDRTVSLPLSPGLGDDQVDFVIESVRKALG